MSTRDEDEVEVCVDLEGLGGPHPMGRLCRRRSRSTDVVSFAYEAPWLQRFGRWSFDPDLALLPGAQYPAPDRSLFGIFLDSAPDRWGRLLLQRREALRARREGRRARALTDWDFLLGVQDETRLGALRFRFGPDLPFVDHDPQLAAPPITTLRELQAASLAFEEHEERGEQPEAERWLAQLFAPGSSLGGARPKASVRDEKGELCLAKFPSRRDTRDIGAWQLVAHRLAVRAGIAAAAGRPLRLPGSSHTTFVTQRFDRTPRGGRRAFVSAMTLTQRRDGEPGASYLELVDLLQSRGAAARVDCRELFRRVVFSILIHNTDDHLRNHGFFLEPEGLRLAPAYDLNPDPTGRELSLAIDEIQTRCDVGIALEACQDYGLRLAEASSLVGEVREAVAGWRRESKELGIPSWEQDLLARAFES